MTRQKPQHPVPDRGREPATIDSRQLFNGERALIVKHGGIPYTLRITSNNKLILTK